MCPLMFARFYYISFRIDSILDSLMPIIQCFACTSQLVGWCFSHSCVSSCLISFRGFFSLLLGCVCMCQFCFKFCCCCDLFYCFSLFVRCLVYMRRNSQCLYAWDGSFIVIISIWMTFSICFDCFFCLMFYFWFGNFWSMKANFQFVFYFLWVFFLATWK